MAAGLLATLIVDNPVSFWVDVVPLSLQDRWPRAVNLCTVIWLLCIVSLARTTCDPPG